MHNTLVELKRFDTGTSKDIMYKNSMMRSDSLRATEVQHVVSRPAIRMARQQPISKSKVELKRPHGRALSTVTAEN